MLVGGREAVSGAAPGREDPATAGCRTGLGAPLRTRPGPRRRRHSGDRCAGELALRSALQFLHLRLGDPWPLPGPEEVAAFDWTDSARAFVEQRQADQIIGSPATVRAGIEELVERTAVDELMITTATYRGEDLLRSYELVADAVGTGSSATAA